MPESKKVQRAKLYGDRNTQILLSKFLSGDTTELEPVCDHRHGYRYPVVEKIIGRDSDAAVFLNRLHDAGILKRRLYDTIIHCSKCGSASVSVRYSCPYCKSFNIQKSSLIEHVKCGYMDVEENFQKGKMLVCPKCNVELRKSDVDFRRAGIWCTCNDCGKSFDIPVTIHFCRDCRTESTFEDAVVTNVYAYSLEDKVKEEIAEGWAIITPVKEFLQKHGFEVESPAFLRGKSGANHMFDIAAYKGDVKRKVTVIDLATSRENAVPEQRVIALFAKMFDVSPDQAYLIAMPKMNENGRKMAELYNINLVEAKNQKEVRKVLEDKMLGEE